MASTCEKSLIWSKKDQENGADRLALRITLRNATDAFWKDYLYEALPCAAFACARQRTCFPAHGFEVRGKWRPGRRVSSCDATLPATFPRRPYSLGQSCLCFSEWFSLFGAEPRLTLEPKACQARFGRSWRLFLFIVNIARQKGTT